MHWRGQEPRSHPLHSIHPALEPRTRVENDRSAGAGAGRVVCHQGSAASTCRGVRNGDLPRPQTLQRRCWACSTPQHWLDAAIGKHENLFYVPCGDCTAHRQKGKRKVLAWTGMLVAALGVSIRAYCTRGPAECGQRQLGAHEPTKQGGLRWQGRAVEGCRPAELEGEKNGEGQGLGGSS